MLSMLLEHASYEKLPAERSVAIKPWKTVLNFAIAHHAVALIDAGALLAGVNNRDAAKYALDLLGQQALADDGLKAVVYFDASASHGSWTVQSHDGRCWPLNNSPIHERDAFVIFDERHCRGADMKLRRRGRAVVSLGPKMAKDKLMQVIGVHVFL